MPPARKTVQPAQPAEARPEVAEDAEAAAQEDDQPGEGADVDPTTTSTDPLPPSPLDEWDVPDPSGEYSDDASGAPGGDASGGDGGPAIVPGAFGTTVDPTDPRLGKLRVEVRSNISLDNEVLTPFRKVEVVDTPEVRSIIAVGHLRLLEDDEDLDDE